MNEPGKRSAPLTTGSVGRQLVRMTTPMLMGILSIMVFHLADAFFLGRYGTGALTAVTFTFPVVMTLGSLALGLGVGVSAVVANAIGEGNQSLVRRLSTDSLLLSLLVVTACAGAGLLTIDPLFRALGADGDILFQVRQYMEIWYWSVGLVVIPMVGNSAIRATGDTRTPSLVMMVAAITNVVLDPLLIFGLGPFPEMGVQGAALATACSRALTLLASIYVLGVREKMISVRGLRVRVLIDSWRRILHVGLPAAGTRMVAPLGVGVITGLIATYGAPSVAAFGLGSRVGMFVFSVIMAQGAALAPFVGQNLGAGRIDRVRRAAWLSCGFAFGYGIVLWLIMAIVARPLASLFNQDQEVVAVAASYFRIVPIGAGFSAVAALTGSVLNAMLKPGSAAGLTVLQMFVLNIPLSFLGSKLIGLPGVFWAAVIANVVTGLVAVVVLRRQFDPSRTSR
jgi:MATE family, multidrug efflux pump